jgi:hypothetical protein
MKATLRISILLNLTLLGGLIFLLANQRRQAASPAPVLSEANTPAKTAPAPASGVQSNMDLAPFRWSQLASAKDYQAYIANLRAIGCPEPTIEDIVRGDTDRAFSWERNQWGLNGSGNGPWSRQAEMQLVASLLGAQPPVGTTSLAQNTGNPSDANNGTEVASSSGPSPGARTESPAYPLFLQNVNWNALGFTPDEQAAIAQVRQQFLNETANLNQKPGDAANPDLDAASANGAPSNSTPTDSAALTQWQKALQDANDQLLGLLGAQDYMAYEQQQYYAWYQPQVAAAAASGEPLTINPAAFH